jgi:DHA1 family tetracycline resistance protein-like MFS transporter
MMVLYTAYRYGWSALDFGIFCVGLSLVSIAVQAFVAGRAAQRFGEQRTAIAGLTLEIVGMTAMGLAPNGTLFALANLPTALGGVATPALQTLMTLKVAPDEQGRLQGAIGSIASFTSIVAPIGFTQIFAWAIASAHGATWSGVTMLIGAALTVAACGLVFARGTPRGRDDLSSRMRPHIKA